MCSMRALLVLAAQRAAVAKPLEDSAEGAVKVTWLKPEKKRPAPT